MKLTRGEIEKIRHALYVLRREYKEKSREGSDNKGRYERLISQSLVIDGKLSDMVNESE